MSPDGHLRAVTEANSDRQNADLASATHAQEVVDPFEAEYLTGWRVWTVGLAIVLSMFLVGWDSCYVAA